MHKNQISQSSYYYFMFIDAELYNIIVCDNFKNYRLVSITNVMNNSFIL